MKNFDIIYRILKTLEKSLDNDELDLEAFMPDNFGVSRSRFYSLLEMLYSEGYIDGLRVVNSIAGKTYRLENMRITIKGLEFLEENSLMKKAANTAKGITEVIGNIL